jgi:DNA adenine methylase
MSTITALVPWFGAKRAMSSEIVAVIGVHSVYWEPFCGSMAVLLAKTPCKTEVINDLHGDLVNLARVIQHPQLGPTLYRRLRRVMQCETFFRDSLAAVRAESPSEDLDVDRAFYYFITSWQGMNGVAGTSSYNTNFARRFSSNGGDSATRWTGAVRSIPQWRRRLEGVQILRSDGIGLCERIEDKTGTVIYADPPYLVKGAKYLHDFGDADHERLAKALGRYRLTRVIVSYYDHPRLANLYPGWRKHSVDMTKGMVNSAKATPGATKAPEVLLSNLPRPGRVEHHPLFGDAP